MSKQKNKILMVLLIIFAITFLMGAPDPKDIIADFTETISFVRR